MDGRGCSDSRAGSGCGGRPYGLMGVHGGPEAGSSELLCHQRLPAPFQRHCYFLQDTSRPRRPGWPCHGSSTNPPSSLPTWEPRHSVGVLRPFQAKHAGLGSTPSWWACLGRCPSPSHLRRASGYSPQAVPPPGPLAESSRGSGPQAAASSKKTVCRKAQRFPTPCAHPKCTAVGARLTLSVLRAP